ncbi:MAG: hypothetical protein WA139_04445 [Candidatus Aenigmatarchaeota archaeon]
MVCPYFVSGTGGCGAEKMIIVALSGKGNEGGAIFYSTGQGNCHEGFPDCDTFKYAKELK